MLGNNIRLTDAKHGVIFDLNANGTAELTAWTVPGTDDAFLALDRNGNGVIDNGAELFGDHTSQPPSWTPDGFKALAVYDGNHDGKIDAADPVFAQLLVWRDENHDGSSQAGELYPAVQLGVTAISLDEQVTGRRDAFGNQFRYRAKIVGLRGQPFAYDVFLQRGQ